MAKKKRWPYALLVSFDFIHHIRSSRQFARLVVLLMQHERYATLRNVTHSWFDQIFHAFSMQMSFLTFLECDFRFFYVFHPFYVQPSLPTIHQEKLSHLTSFSHMRKVEICFDFATRNSFFFSVDIFSHQQKLFENGGRRGSGSIVCWG